MSDPGLSRRKQQLLDKFLSGEIDQPTYDRLLGELQSLGTSEDDSAATGLSNPSSTTSASTPSVSVTESRSEAERSALSQPIALLEVGTELGGFRLECRLRRGGMGEVWKAYDETGERSVVIKVLPPELQRSPDEMVRVKQTFNRVHNLQHQHICPVYLLGQDPRFGYFIVMKYLDGDTLSAYRKTLVKSQGSFSLRDVARVLMPIARALDYAHSRQIIHRDIKPQNIMLSADGSDVQLVDFGLAAEVRTSVMRVSQVQMETCGTYPYMAPEQWRGELQDARTDQYALAVVAYELLSGHLPFEGADPTVLRMCVLNDSPPEIVGVDVTVNAALARGLAKSRSDRFENCAAFLKALCAPILPKPAVPPVSPKGAVKSPQADDLFAPDVVATAPSRADDSAMLGRSSSRSMASGQPIPLETSSTSRPFSASSSGTMKTRIGRSGSGAARTAGEVDEVEFIEPEDVETSRGRRSPKSPRAVDDFIPAESTLGEANARAMFVISFLVAGACVFFFGLFGWFIFGGYHSLFPSTLPNNLPLAVNGNGKSVGPGTGNNGNGAQPGERPAGKNGPALRYRWADGRSYVYSVNVELEQDNDIVMTMSGNCSYSLGPRPAKLKGEPEEVQGTGTGFVIHAGGYLVTCQHVVDGASGLEVAIGGKKYPATVIVEDVDHDLAVIHIEAAGLPTLPLADSEGVRLGEEVRAIGFPLSSILGDNVKATRGTVSGINTEDDRKVFQVDAGINPGNSGGPLVNERGEVVGVNFAKLRDEFGANVGFAVPVNYAAELLAGEGILFAKGDGKGAKLDGPDLVTRVSAATALITVSGGGGGAAAAGAEHIALRCHGMLNPSVRSKSGRPIDPASTLSLQHQQLRRAMSRAFSDTDFVETDAFGRIHDVSADGQSLPGFLGRLSRMVLEQFPSTRRPTWVHSFPITIVISEESGDALGPVTRFRPHFRPPGFPPLPGMPRNEPKVTKFPGKIKISYAIQETVGNLIRIKKELELEARDPAGGDPRVHLTGSGVIEFDTAMGIPHSMEFTGTLAEKEANKTTRLPVKLSYRLNNDPAAKVANAPIQPAAPMKPGAPMPPGKLLDDDAVLAVGTKLVAEWAGNWLPVEVLEVKPNGKVRIHWVGWSSQFDEELPRTRLRYPAVVIPAVPGAPQPTTSRPADVAPQKISREEIEQSLVDIREWDVCKANLAARKLQHAIPLDECRDDVLKCLEELLKSRDQFQRKQAIDAMATWAKPDTIPVLIKCLDETALLVKVAAIEALGRLKDERAAKPLALLVSEPESRPHAMKALQMIGTKAESAVVELLKHPDSIVRQEACKLLKEFGTSSSNSALQAAATDADSEVASLAKDALSTIGQRK